MILVVGVEHVLDSVQDGSNFCPSAEGSSVLDPYNSLDPPFTCVVQDWNKPLLPPQQGERNSPYQAEGCQRSAPVNRFWTVAQLDSMGTSLDNHAA